MQNSKSVIKSQKRKKEKAVQAFGGKCCICGYDRCLGALEFHHVDRNTKQVSPSYIILRWAWERIKTELDKCILVCANCHREIEEKQIDISFLSRQVKPFVKRQCKQCKQDFDTKDYSQRFCSTECAGLNQRKCVRPSKSELSVLIKACPWVQIGRMFGVSDNAVRKWARTYELI